MKALEVIRWKSLNDRVFLTTGIVTDEDQEFVTVSSYIYQSDNTYKAHGVVTCINDGIKISKEVIIQRERLDEYFRNDSKA